MGRQLHSRDNATTTENRQPRGGDLPPHPDGCYRPFVYPHQKSRGANVGWREYAKKWEEDDVSKETPEETLVRWRKERRPAAKELEMSIKEGEEAARREAKGAVPKGEGQSTFRNTDYRLRDDPGTIVIREGAD